MIIAGYPGIGKSLYIKLNYRKTSFNGICDLESSNFRDFEGNRPACWSEMYANTALDLASQGALVFVPTHSAVVNGIKYLIANKTKPIDDRFKFFGIAPSLILKDEWIKSLADRYKRTNLDKDLRAYERARDYFNDDIAAFQRSLYVYSITEMPKDQIEFYKAIDAIIENSENKEFLFEKRNQIQ